MEFGSQHVRVDDEYEKLVIRMNPPRVTVDNTTSRNATLVKVDSANTYGSLLEVVQALIDLNLTITRAYISSDGEWFMDVFYVVDRHGNKLSDGEVIDRIQQSLGAIRRSSLHRRRSVAVVESPAAAKHTSIELTGADRPGLLSEVFAVLADLRCNVVATQVWTHNARMASLVYITDDETDEPITDSDRLATIKRLLQYILRCGGARDALAAEAAAAGTHTERRLHQLMHADRGSDDRERSIPAKGDPMVSVEECSDKGYTMVNVRCTDRPKLLFDTVCTLTDMKYVVFHATVLAEGPVASQEYYIRHLDGSPVTSEVERQSLINCLEAAISRRTSQGLRLELRGEDRVGLLSDVTRIFRENGLKVARAEVATRGTRASHVFYVADASGAEGVDPRTIEAVRNEIGRAILSVKEEGESSKSTAEDGGGRLSSIGSLFRSRSEKLLSNWGLIRS